MCSFYHRKKKTVQKNNEKSTITIKGNSWSEWKTFPAALATSWSMSIIYVVIKYVFIRIKTAMAKDLPT